VIFNSKRVLERSSDVCYFKYYSIWFTKQSQ
jgi:hypothetical protein